MVQIYLLIKLIFKNQLGSYQAYGDRDFLEF